MHVDNLFLRLDGRVFEALSDESSYAHRVHVDVVGFAVKGPDRDGRYVALIGMLRDGELFRGAGVTKVRLDPAEFERFSAFVEVAKAQRAAGPEPW